MQYSTFYPDSLHKQIINKIDSYDSSDEYDECDEFVFTDHAIYIQFPELSGPIEKFFGFRIKIEDDKFQTYMLTAEKISGTKDEFIKKYTDQIMKIKPCKICIKLINCDNDLCHSCNIKQSVDLTIFQQKCGICQDVISKYGKIMKCCGKLIHTNCYKIYKYKKINNSDDCYIHDGIKCPYCKELLFEL